MDYSLEMTRHKESMLRALRSMQSKSESTLQRAAPLLSFQRGMGMVTREDVRRLCQTSARLCQDLDDLTNRLKLQQNQLVGRLAEGGRAPRGVHVSSDGTVYLTSGDLARVSVLNSSGQFLQSLECQSESQLFLPEDVTLTRAGMVAVTDLAAGDVKVFNTHSKFGKGEWISLGEFTSPQGMAVDCLGRLLVADYVPGKVHIFGVDPSFKLLSAHCMSGLPGPRYISPGPDGGLVVSEECGDVKLYGPGNKQILSFSEKYNHCFGNPAGVCFDTEGNVFVADEQHRCIFLFPPSGPPVPVVTQGLKKPAGLACCSRGQLYVADTADDCIKVFRYRGTVRHGKGFASLNSNQ
ncbi:E3 ubiquitin-protein ligase TRIM32-like [Polyodon spathula]|uniref:E3 ubiquitin-protein ligase TRIM32-like n=1 Tax=Polyodon spathula TaxID=7913 RepID=UPI001B7F749D|nr:E3 ubiquitin-protein ligase TRIM32-like [Polyodon spathula]